MKGKKMGLGTPSRLALCAAACWVGISCQYKESHLARRATGAGPAVTAEGAEDMALTARTGQRAPGAYKPRIRNYYVAAEDVSWDYAPTGRNQIKEEMGLGPWGKVRVFAKTRYVEYTDSTFTVRKPQPRHLGVLGPTLRAVVGDTLRVHFVNFGRQPYSLHPHGVIYTKDNEGAPYAGIPGKGHAIPPGGSYTYHWEVPERAGPGPRDGSSVVWLYHSHVNSDFNIFSGLVGTIVVTAADKATEDARPVDVDREFVTLFLIFDENAFGQAFEGNLKHAINGFLFGNLPGLRMKKGERVRWYLVGLGNEADLHTPHWHGETVVHLGRRTDVVELLPASMHVADMVAENPGTWMYHCHVSDHMMAGMQALYTIEP
jgi:FtsP/CotA-like multicopper oxidase with cupredoxin domain